jgi:hypothetical protein
VVSASLVLGLCVNSEAPPCMRQRNITYQRYSFKYVCWEFPVLTLSIAPALGQPVPWCCLLLHAQWPRATGQQGRELFPKVCTRSKDWTTVDDQALSARQRATAVD